MASINPYKNGRWRVEVYRHGQRASKVFDEKEEAQLWAEKTTQDIDAQAKRFKQSEVLVRDGPSLVTMIPTVVLMATREIPHSTSDVLAAAIPLHVESGVYFLIKGGEVVYVGQSVNVLHRIARHKREGKVFDSFSFITAKTSELDRLEALYIRVFVPEENVSFGKPLKKSG